MLRCSKLITAMTVFSFWPISSFAQTSSEWGVGMYHGWGWGGMMFGGAMMIVFLGVFILAVVLLVRAFGGSQTGNSGHPASVTPLDILKERFAKGEIDAKEYQERKKLLLG